MEATEANLNYLNGQTDSLLTTIDTDDLRPLPARVPRINRQPEEVEYEYNITKKHYHENNYVDPGAAIDDRLAELDLNKHNLNGAGGPRQQLSRLNMTVPNLQSSDMLGGLESIGGDFRSYQLSLSSGIIDKALLLSPSRLSRTMSGSRELLPSKFVTSPVAKKSWMNLNTNLFKASTAALSDAHRIIPTMGQYLTSNLLRHHNVIRRGSQKGAYSPYYQRSGALPRQRGVLDVPMLPLNGLQDYSLESPMSSVSTSPYFRFEDFTAGNMNDPRGVSQFGSIHPNSHEMLYFPQINPELNYLDQSGRLQMVPQATFSSGRYFSMQDQLGGGAGHAAHCDHPSHSSTGGQSVQRVNQPYSPRK